MRLHLGLTLLVVASGLTACAAQTSVSAGQLITPTALAILPVTATATVATATHTPTRIPSPTLAPTQTATARPTETITPAPLEPTAVLTPIPIAPPQPDGILRTADVPILMYHYISAAPSAEDRIRYGLSVPPEMFEAQLKLLQGNGFTTITLRELYEHLAIGTPLPDKPIVITLDDGYLDNYTNAFPILQKYGMTATFFVLTAPADDGNPTYLSWDMIQEMSSAGMDIQLHSRDHLDMRNRSIEWLYFQVIGGRQSIEGHTGKPVIFMAYPSGKYDANLQRFLRENSFWGAVTTAPGSRHVLKEALNWDRVRISGQLRLKDFARLLGIPLTIQRAVPEPTATPSQRDPEAVPTGIVEIPATTIATLRPTAVPTMTPVASPPPNTPTRTPFSSPLQTPTPHIPLMTPTP